jgi:hypothetical protein
LLSPKSAALKKSTKAAKDWYILIFQSFEYDLLDSFVTFVDS